MSNHIKVDTAYITAAANKIANYNTAIRNDFSAVENAIKSLGSVWESVASHNAINSFHSIKNAYYDNRYHVVENYVTFLRQQVDEGYTQTETVNKSLADAFK